MEEIEKKKSQLLAQRDDNTRMRSKKITETGQVLMTIDNLYKKCQAHTDVFPWSMTSKYMQQFPQFDEVNSFNDTYLSGRKAEI